MAVKDWTAERCGPCLGYGVVARSGDGMPEECEDCGGDGQVWRSPSGTRLAQWPGGPFVGSVIAAAPASPGVDDQREQIDGA